MVGSNVQSLFGGLPGMGKIFARLADVSQGEQPKSATRLWMGSQVVRQGFDGILISAGFQIEFSESETGAFRGRGGGDGVSCRFEGLDGEIQGCAAILP